MEVEGRVGELRGSTGAIQDIRLTPYGSQAVSDTHARYFESNRIGRLYVAANSATQVLSVGSATATGLVLTNPAGSGKALVIDEITCGIVAAVTGVGAVAVYANVNSIAAAVTHTTPLTVRPAMLGNSTTSVGLADSSATLPATPVIVRNLIGLQWVTANTTVAPLFVKDEVAGALALTPGTAISIQAVTTAVTCVSSITWEEVDWPL